MLEVRIVGEKLGQTHWGVWDTEKGDWIRDKSGLVEARTSLQSAQELKEYIDRVGVAVYKTIPKPEQVAKGTKAYTEMLAEFAGAPVEALKGLQRSASKWEAGMLRYIGDPLRPVRLDIESLGRRISRRPGAPWAEVQSILDQVTQAPLQDMMRLRTRLAEIARLLGIRVKAGI